MSKKRQKAPETGAVNDNETVRRGPKRSERPTGLPIYPTIQACSAATGIPAAALKLAKRQGCNAFLYSRVDLALFLKFTFSPEGKDIQNWADYKMEAEAKRTWLKLEKDEGSVIDRGVVRDGIAQLAGVIDSALERVFVNEFPPASVGLDAMAVSVLAKASKAKVWEQIRTQSDEILKSAETEPT